MLAACSTAGFFVEVCCTLRLGQVCGNSAVGDSWDQGNVQDAVGVCAPGLPRAEQLLGQVAELRGNVGPGRDLPPSYPPALCCSEALLSCPDVREVTQSTEPRRCARACL